MSLFGVKLIVYIHVKPLDLQFFLKWFDTFFWNGGIHMFDSFATLLLLNNVIVFTQNIVTFQTLQTDSILKLSCIDLNSWSACSAEADEKILK